MATTGGHVQGFGQTNRTDRWWVGPAATAGGLGAWLLYYAWAAFQGKYWAAGPYISPFYITYTHPTSVTDTSPAYAFWGMWPEWWPALITPALILGFLPGTFRVTCYYYRKAYYRAFFGMPPGCAVGPRPVNYRGETGLLLFQNLHRYTLYLALLLLPILYYEAALSYSWGGELGIGLGSVILTINCFRITGYTLGCHAWRHLIGGRLDCFSCDGISEARHGAWRFTTWLNIRHMRFAWMSLYWFLFTDVFIRLMSMGYLPDINTWNGISWIADFH